MRHRRRLALSCAVPLVLFAAPLLLADRPTTDRGQLFADFDRGNFQTAYEGLRLRLIEGTDAESDPDGARAAEEYTRAAHCLARLNRLDELDAFREAAVTARSGAWRFLWEVAKSYRDTLHHGRRVAGAFERGHHREGGEPAHATARDRVRALQLMAAAAVAARAARAPLPGGFYLDWGATLLAGAEGLLAGLTDLTQLPDYEDGYSYHVQPWAPVDAGGSPIFHALPADLAAAKSDGERWRWLMMMSAEAGPGDAVSAKLTMAQFLEQQFGVESLARAHWRYWDGDDGDAAKDSSQAVYALHTLAEDETIARLANGVRRFRLPDELNPIRIYQSIARSGPSHQQHALEALAQIYENRRQFPKAAESWRLSGNAGRERRITGNWGRFEPLGAQPAGEKAKIAYRFRNGSKVHFSARAVDVDLLLRDVMDYLKSDPGRLDWQKLNLENLGHRLLVENEEKYLGAEVAAWDEALTPRPEHFDRRVTITTPLDKAGAYLLGARMENGNTNYVVLWLHDTAIARKSIHQGYYHFIADAVTGAPIPGATVEFFGYRQEHRDPNKFDIHTRRFAETSDANGQVTTTAERQERQYQWLTIARTKEGRLAFLGFSWSWHGEYQDIVLERPVAYGITDRPVYRPAQPVKFKFWLAHASYDKEGPSPFAGAAVTLLLHDPRGEKIWDKTFTADAYGGVDGEYLLPAGATLGVYQLVVQAHSYTHGSLPFRVEEYKKPEFEVLVEAPDAPIELGSSFAATIRARYYFGAPVTEATVRYKVTRSGGEDRWFPIGPWDWLYGNGYGWCAYDCEWYPGWRTWGCRRPIALWWGRPDAPPEVVAEGEAALGPDGTYRIVIDSAIAKAQHGDETQEYGITAEVVDASRRTIVGAGRVTAAAKPFSVYVWLDRGYAAPGEDVTAHFAARTPDGKSVAAAGSATLYRIRYDDRGKPEETVVAEWKASTNETGSGSLRFVAAEAGQFRFSATLEREGRRIEGGALFSIVGASAAAYRFTPIELVPDRSEYRPGEKVRLLVGTERSGSTVLLFLRPVNGVYRPPQVLRLTERTQVVEINVAHSDMPNFFVEGVTIGGGRLHAELREILVPPEKRLLHVSVEPSAREFLPGAEGSVTLHLTDFHGEPFVGSMVLAVYDKAVEAIAGGSNVPPIAKHFWEWRRSHYPNTDHSLARRSRPEQPRDTERMEDLGIFGGVVTGGARGDRWGRMEDGYGELEFGHEVAEGAAQSTRALGAAPAAERKRGKSRAVDALDEESDAASDGGEEALVAAAIRKEFADTALWVAAIETDREGRARMPLRMPENLTTWKVKAWALGTGTRVGEGEAEIVTRKNLLLRMQAPRFFTERDEVVLSANVHNYLASGKRVKVDLELPGKELLLAGESSHWVEIASGAEARVDWRVRVAASGTAVVRMVARSDEESDAMELRFPVHTHGILKTDSVSGVVRPDADSGRFTIRVPEERRIADSRLEIRYSPTLAGAMVDALPYLVAYPYGCTEQTLNRFLPAAITQKVLTDMGLDLAAIRDKRTNLDSQEIGDDRERAAGWRRLEENPVFDRDKLHAIVRAGVDRLLAMQLSDGGWGWFSGYGEWSSAHTTATVVHGLGLARDYGVTLVPGMLERGVEWLKRHQTAEIQKLENAPTQTHPWKSRADDLDALVFLVLVEAGSPSAEMEEFLVRDRIDLSLYSKSMLALALHRLGKRDRLALLRENIEQFLEQDVENQTAWLRQPGNCWWYWYGSEFEALAYALKLYTRLDPKGTIASRLAKYLLTNRKHASYWNSTRDTALCIEALAEYLKASGEAAPDVTVEIWLDGEKRKEERITAENLFAFDNRFVLFGDAVESGEHLIEVRRKGRGPVYFNAYLTCFSMKEGIPSAGLELRVERKLYRLLPVDATKPVRDDRGQVLEQKVDKYERREVTNLATLESGALVEVELEIESKNDYEYLVFEDHKGAGFEPVGVQSGYVGSYPQAYMELRDRQVSFFLRHLARGRHSLSYRARAEIPGSFSALPTLAYAMYAPELRGNSAEIRVLIADRAQ